MLIHEMVSHKPFSNQEICHIDSNCEKIICTVSTYITEFLIIVEIDNKQCHRCSNMKPHFEFISDKLIMLLGVLPNSNSSRRIDHPKYTTLTKYNVVLDVLLHNYFKDSFLDNVIRENC